MPQKGIERFVEPISTIPGITQCIVKNETTLDLWVQYVMEDGRRLRITIDDTAVYCKDAPAAIFSRAGYTVANGHHLHFASLVLTGQWDEVCANDPSNDLFPSIGDNDEVGSRSRQKRIDRLAQKCESILRHYLAGYPEDLHALLDVFDARSKLEFNFWEPVSGKERSLSALLRSYPGLAWHWIKWYAQRPYEFGEPHQFCWNASDDYFWVCGGTPGPKIREWMRGMDETYLPTVYRLVFHPSSKCRVEIPSDDAHRTLARLLAEGDESAVRRFVMSKAGRRVFAPGDRQAGRSSAFGSYCGFPLAQWRTPAQRLRRTGEGRAAELLLLNLLAVAERVADQYGIEVDPWYYDQLKAVYKDTNQRRQEAAIARRQIEREGRQAAAPPRSW